jgi:hypothetical protein
MTRGSTQVTSPKCQLGLTKVNICIKIIIIIILKSKLGVFLEQGSSHKLEGSTWVDQNFIIRKLNQPRFD